MNKNEIKSAAAILGSLGGKVGGKVKSARKRRAAMSNLAAAWNAPKGKRSQTSAENLKKARQAREAKRKSQAQSGTSANQAQA